MSVKMKQRIEYHRTTTITKYFLNKHQKENIPNLQPDAPSATNETHKTAKWLYEQNLM